MTGRSASQYPSTKFFPLTASESTVRAKRNYFTWVIGVTILFGITVGFLCHKLFVAPAYFNDTLSHSPNDHNDFSIKHTTRKPILKVLHSGGVFIERTGKDQPEFLCERAQSQSETIPLTFRNKILQELFSKDSYYYIKKSLLVHYGSIINKHKPRYLKSVFNRYLLKLSAVRQSSHFVNFLRGLTSNRLKFYAEYLKKQKFQLQIKEFNWIFSLTEELNQWYNYLDLLPSFFSDYQAQNRKKKFGNVTKIDFATFVEETHLKLFHFAYPFSVTEKKLDEINEILTEWTKPVQVNYSNCSLTLFNKVVLLSEVNEQLRALNASCLKNVYVFASRIVYLDAHVELYGVNLAIIAPKWEFLKTIKINLDGVLGAEHAPNTATAGQAGKPGNPGGNGGDFLGVGGLQEKFLAISTNGGIGGSGQNGAKGHDGLSNTRPVPPFDKPACLIQDMRLKNLFPAKMTHYKIYNEAGCGGSGADGGVGGQGGHGGLITLISRNSVKIMNGSNGTLGRPGKGGPGGTGGRNGCFYEAVDENDEFLHPITTIKCPTGNILPAGQFGKDGYNSRGQNFPPEKKNLIVQHCISHYIQLAREHFAKYNDPHVMSFLKELHTYGETELEDLVRDFKSIEAFDKIEYYQLFKEKLTERVRIREKDTLLIFNFLKSVVLGEMTYLKKNINYFFVDMNNYLNILQESIRSMNESSQGLQAVSYFKRKVAMKMDKIKQNLKLLKMKLNSTEVGFRNGSEYSFEELQKRISCIVGLTIDVIGFLMHHSSQTANLGLNNLLSICWSMAQTIPQSSGILMQKDLANAEETLLRVLQTILFADESETRGYLIELKNAFLILEESGVLFEHQKMLLQDLRDELDHFLALQSFVEWGKLEDLFSRSLGDLTANSSGNADTEFLKVRLRDVKIAIQLKLAETASWQNSYPLSKRHVLLLPRKKALSDVFSQVDIMRDLNEKGPFCRNHMKAVFEKNSTVGEFFSWTNAEINNKLKVLFEGAEINLRSDLINRHVVNKNFLQFTSVKLEFDCLGNESLCEKLQETLSNFRVDVTHSGYSYYNWRDGTHVVISERMTLSYSFKTRNNQEPELYNAFFKKCQNGEIKLSPFTTWAVRLLPINDRANFSELTSFADFVNLNLVGTGTFALSTVPGESK